MASDAERVHRVAEGIRDWGYPDTTDDEVQDVLAAMERGDDELPHGVLGHLIEGLARG